MLDNGEICVVTGLPRSGTSLMMQMLEGAGFDLLYDDVKEPDEDNPKGYYEYSKMYDLKDGNDDWLRDCFKKVINVNGELLLYVPFFDYVDYKIIYMTRDYREIAESQKKKMDLENEDDFDLSEHIRLMISLDNRMRAYVEDRCNVEVVYVSYNDLVDDPRIGISPLKFLFDIDKETEDRMLEEIDEDLYRNRNK